MKFNTKYKKKIILKKINSMKGFVSVQFFTSKYGIPNNIECLLYKVTKLLYICVSFWLLAHESRDLPQAETKIILFKSWTNLQNDNYFHSKWWLTEKS